ncbi:MAG TPA: hypothetical protein VGF48_17150 [Thermoanaerobaculia bacterium]|jgi:hypothetical protein
MSTKEKNESKVTAVPAVNYRQVAQERLDELRRWREQIPRFVMPESADALKRLSSAASVPAAFIEQTSIATANHRPLVIAESPTPDEVRELAAYSDAFDPLADELEALANFIRYSTKAARSKAGHAALNTYALATRLAKRPETAYLAPYVADMRRALGRGRKSAAETAARKAAKAARAAAAPQPEPDLPPAA